MAVVSDGEVDHIANFIRGSGIRELRYYRSVFDLQKLALF